MPKTINEILQEQATSHMHFVERYKGGVVNEMFEIMQEAEDLERAKLLVTPDSARFSRKKSKALIDSMVAIENTYAKKYNKLINDNWKDFGGYEAEFVANQIESNLAGFGVSVNVSAPTAQQVYAAATASNNPLILDNGKEVIDLIPTIKVVKGEEFQNIKLRRSKQMEKTLKAGFVQGKTNQEISRDIFGLSSEEYTKRGGSLKQARNYAKMTTRTGTNHMASTARQKVAEDNNDLVKGYEIVATLDLRTSPICRDLDGKYWIHGNPDASTLSNQVYPPFHRYCRTMGALLLKSWRDMGIDANEIPKGTRAALNGQVPKSQTYYEWLKTQPVKSQKEVLGKSRYNLWNEGKVTPDKFMDRDGNYLNLDKLKAKDKEFVK